MTGAGGCVRSTNAQEATTGGGKGTTAIGKPDPQTWKQRRCWEREKMRKRGGGGWRDV